MSKTTRVLFGLFLLFLLVILMTVGSLLAGTFEIFWHKIEGPEADNRTKIENSTKIIILDRYETWNTEISKHIIM